MIPIHHREKEQFKKLFKQEYIDRFEDRYEVLKGFLQTERHVTATELSQFMSRQGRNLALDFVRETLQLMCRFGFARKNRFDNGQVRYEHRHLGQHHDHMICTKCRKIIEFRDDQMEALQVKISRSHGFHMLQHRMEIYGICSNCLRQQVALMPLHMAKAGERLTIREFAGGAKAHMRLLAMGLKVGDEIEVLTNHNQGQLVVAVDCTRYVLGRGLAQKIMISQKNSTI